MGSAPNGGVMEDMVLEISEVEALRAALEDRDRVAMAFAAKARRLEEAIVLHRRRRLGQADDVAFLLGTDIDSLLWQELEPTPENSPLYLS